MCVVYINKKFLDTPVRPAFWKVDGTGWFSSSQYFYKGVSVPFIDIYVVKEFLRSAELWLKNTDVRWCKNDEREFSLNLAWHGLLLTARQIVCPLSHKLSVPALNRNKHNLLVQHKKGIGSQKTGFFSKGIPKVKT